jgi:hypothetical protein
MLKEIGKVALIVIVVMAIVKQLKNSNETIDKYL